MATSFPDHYFKEIRTIWAAYQPKRIIPFCTPVFRDPIALVIGTNHSDFAQDLRRSEEIADNFASALPKENTFLLHDHRFAKGIREVVARAGLVLDERWIGTNRCAVQTGPIGIGSLRRTPHFRESEKRMDELLKRLIEDLRPRNIILTGGYACDLFYPDAQIFQDRPPRELDLKDGKKAKIIPIKHPSRGSNYKHAVKNLTRHFKT
ncbi:MAG TPA: uracil-DNA glycosylase family protein [Acidobacteriota bacterium]|nr:uracil-DNA glycosylase family protein [Acidobacteriota bacterium]